MEEKLRILIVDDEKMNLDMMSNILNGLFRIEITKCKNGKEAFENYKNEPYPLVFSDTKMPEMNGIELLKEIKDHPYGKNTKVILFSGFSEINFDKQAMSLGAYEFLYKPIDIGIVIEIIQQTLKEMELQ